jgi:phosphatidylserine decarboxylase
MKFHPTGITPVLVLIAAVLAVLWMVNTVFPVQTIVHMVLYAVGVVFLGLAIRFFRFPQRRAKLNPDLVYSGADGKVVAIEHVFVEEYFKSERIQVSVFMSPLDVHINWSPLGGQLVYRKYHPGKHLVAYIPKSSFENEHTSFVIKDKRQREIMVRQIAGALARRILLVPKEGDRVGQGDYIGIIKFGSRVDILLPTDAKVKVEIGDKTVATETVIAELIS